MKDPLKKTYQNSGIVLNRATATLCSDLSKLKGKLIVPAIPSICSVWQFSSNYRAIHYKMQRKEGSDRGGGHCFAFKDRI